MAQADKQNADILDQFRSLKEAFTVFEKQYAQSPPPEVASNQLEAELKEAVADRKECFEKLIKWQKYANNLKEQVRVVRQQGEKAKEAFRNEKAELQAELARITDAYKRVEHQLAHLKRSSTLELKKAEEASQKRKREVESLKAEWGNKVVEMKTVVEERDQLLEAVDQAVQVLKRPRITSKENDGDQARSRCERCGRYGHDKDADDCPKKGIPIVEKAAPSILIHCSYCGGAGHNIRSCQERKSNEDKE